MGSFLILRPDVAEGSALDDPPEKESKYDQEPGLAEKDLAQASDVAAQQATLEMEPKEEVPFSVNGMASLNRAEAVQKLGEPAPSATGTIESESLQTPTKPQQPLEPQQPKAPKEGPANPSPRTGRTPRGTK